MLAERLPGGSQSSGVFENALPSVVDRSQFTGMDAPTIRPGQRVLSNDGAMLGWIARIDDGTITVARSRRSDLAFEVPVERVAARLRDEVFLDLPGSFYADAYRIEPGTKEAVRRLLPRGHLLRRLVPVLRHGAGSP